MALPQSSQLLLPLHPSTGIITRLLHTRREKEEEKKKKTKGRSSSASSSYIKTSTKSHSDAPSFCLRERDRERERDRSCGGVGLYISGSYDRLSFSCPKGLLCVNHSIGTEEEKNRETENFCWPQFRPDSICRPDKLQSTYDILRPLCYQSREFEEAENVSDDRVHIGYFFIFVCCLLFFFLECRTTSCWWPAAWCSGCFPFDWTSAAIISSKPGRARASADAPRRLEWLVNPTKI